MNCIFCVAWTEVKATRGQRRTRQCANGHRFFTREIAERDLDQPEPRGKQIADAVVLIGKKVDEVAREFGYKSGSHVSRCVKKYHPAYPARIEGRRKRRSNP